MNQPLTMDGTSGDRVPSPRLIQVLRTYCRDLNPAGMHDLRSSLATGHYSWLRHDLASAFGRTAQDAGWWIDAIGDRTTIDGSSVQRQIGSEQRKLWLFLFPDLPFP